jgi:3-deoxy-D-manno-octulosonic acid (KDO) 8-phosphate synthase
LRKEQFLAPIDEIGKGREKTTGEGEDLFWSLRGCGRGYQALEAAMRALGSFSAAGSGQTSQRKGLARSFGSQLMKNAIASLPP